MHEMQNHHQQPDEGKNLKRKRSPENIEAYRRSAIEKKQELLSRELALRERELREYLFLQSGNILDYDESSQALTASLENYHETHRLVSPRIKINLGKNFKEPEVEPNTPTPTPTPPPPPSLPPPPVSIPSPKPSLLNSRNDVSKDDIAAKATKDAEILKRVNELQKMGVWSPKRIPKVPEPPRNKVHWDYLLAEMTWLANDFKEERKWKIALAKKVSKAVLKYFQAREIEEQKIIKEREQKLRKIAKNISSEVKKFWSQIEKLIQYKQQQKQDAQKKKKLEKSLELLVDQTEKYSSMLAQDLQKSIDHPKQESTIEDKSIEKEEEDLKEDSTEISNEEKPVSNERIPFNNLLDEMVTSDNQEDRDYSSFSEESDDESTIKQEDEIEKPEGQDETAVLQKESEIPLDELLKRYNATSGMEEHSVSDIERPPNEDDEQARKERINVAASIAKEAQPTGFTLSTTKVKTKIPFLLRGTLREYQHIGLDWLVTMYEKKLNGILADEMGLGKTIMTIALLAHLACEKGIWGPHLIIVPTSVMLNWELEFKKWCPAFKLLIYYGTPKERKMKRQGWSKPNSFHICVTSYKLVLQDQAAFRRKKWKYIILDEAQHIKNFKSQRWQTLLHFNSKRRLLLTGTPLQNSLMELWSLMHFLMPQVFQSHKEFKDLFDNPVSSMIEGEQEVNEDLINRLHGILRPFILRRLKRDVEKQLPLKHEHIVPCRLSKRQRFLYEEFISSASTQDTLKSGNFLGIVNILMQLRKVCNHPDLFEVRPIVSPFDQERISLPISSLVQNISIKDPLHSVDFSFLNLAFTQNEHLYSFQKRLTMDLIASPAQLKKKFFPESFRSPFTKYYPQLEERISKEKQDNFTHLLYVNQMRCHQQPMYGWNLISSVILKNPGLNPHLVSELQTDQLPPSTRRLFPTLLDRVSQLKDIIQNFVCIIPKARAPTPGIWCSHPDPSVKLATERKNFELCHQLSPMLDIFQPAFVRTQMYFPDKRLIQYDCGKLQELAVLLRHLKSGGHRALIFTQMTRVLDILEIFLNIYGYTYLRLDGTTKIERRQALMERFNQDKKVFLFILSTRSGGVGINLTGADTVIFYDSDWNPAMDAQAQDRCHRIGQTREVHIYRLVSEHTIEENILKKANQKRTLDNVVISGGGFTTDFFTRVNLQELLESQDSSKSMETEETSREQNNLLQVSEQDWVKAVESVEEENDVIAMKRAQKEYSTQFEEFDEMAESKPSEPPKETELDISRNEEDSVESYLTPIQLYALKKLEIEMPVEDINEEVHQMEIDTKETIEEIQRVKEEEEQATSEDDEVLYYEVVV